MSSIKGGQNAVKEGRCFVLRPRAVRYSPRMCRLIASVGWGREAAGGVDLDCTWIEALKIINNTTCPVFWTK